MALKIGTKAPDFKLQSTEGKQFHLSEDAKDEPVVIFFYPKDFTPGCTKEACEFRDQFAAFRDLKIKVYGISTDSIESHEKFRKQHNLPFHLLSDPHGRVCKLYKAKMPLMNVAKRISYLIDKDGNIKMAYQDLFGAEKHIQRMLASSQRQG